MSFDNIYNALLVGGRDDSEQLRKMLEWSVANVSFYKAYKGFSGIGDFPVINKLIVRENELQFLAPQYDTSSLFRVSTSGSTGMPFVVYHCPAKRRQAAADTMAFSEFAGYHIGTRLYYVRMWRSIASKGGVHSWARDIVKWNSDQISPKELKEFLKRLEEDSSEKSVLIYASTLSALFRYMRDNNIKTTAKVCVFMTMSESLPQEARQGIQEMFGAPVVSRYSNSECGLIAQQRHNEDCYQINTASFFVEILKLDSDDQALPGELGRIVVTDLYNYAMPLIRYDTGDLGAIEQTERGKVLTRVEGRRLDFFYSTTGELLSPHILSNMMWGFHEILQYQFVQNGENEYVMKLNSQGRSFGREEELRKLLLSHLGEDADLRFEYVDEIPLLASGKRKYVVNNYKV